MARYEKLDWYSWAIQLKSSGEVIGRLSGIKPDEQLSQIELAYELGQNWWNQGLMTEAVKAIISFFFNEVGFNRVYAVHAHENLASGKVMQKSGMVYEGTARQMLRCNNGMFDMVNYAILAKDHFNTEKEEVSIILYERKYHDDMLFCFLATKDAIGSKLLSAVEAYATEKSIIEIHTQFIYWYREAIVFYPMKGFVEVERNDHFIHMKKHM